MVGSVTNEEIRKIVIARLNTMSDRFKLAIGGFGSLTKEEMISHVSKEDDEIGQKIIEIQLHYMRSLKRL